MYSQEQILVVETVFRYNHSLKDNCETTQRGMFPTKPSEEQNRGELTIKQTNAKSNLLNDSCKLSFKHHLLKQINSSKCQKIN